MDQTNFFLNRYEKFRFLFLPCYLYTVHLHEFHFRKFVQFNMWYKQRDLYFEYCNIKLNLDCNYTFPIDLTRFEIECSLCTGKSLIGYPWCRGTSVSWTAVHLIDAVFASLAWTESMRKADPTIRWICKKMFINDKKKIFTIIILLYTTEKLITVSWTLICKSDS